MTTAHQLTLDYLPVRLRYPDMVQDISTKTLKGAHAAVNGPAATN
jgi:hypothetical protein